MSTPAVQDLIYLALKSFIEEDYASAVDLFTQVIEAEPEKPGHYIDRAKAYLSMRSFEEAQQDVDVAMVMEMSMAAEPSAEAYLLKAAALIGLKQFGTAKSLIGDAVSYYRDDLRFAPLNAKCDDMMEVSRRQGLDMSTPGFVPVPFKGTGSSDTPSADHVGLTLPKTAMYPSSLRLLPIFIKEGEDVYERLCEFARVEKKIIVVLAGFGKVSSKNFRLNSMQGRLSEANSPRIGMILCYNIKSDLVTNGGLLYQGFKAGKNGLRLWTMQIGGRN